MNNCILILYLDIMFIMIIISLAKLEGVMTFLICLEGLVIFMAVSLGTWNSFYLVVILVIGVLEAIVGLSLMIHFSRYYGSDYLYFM